MEFIGKRVELRISHGLFDDFVDKLRRETRGTITPSEVHRLRDDFQVEELPFGDFYLGFCRSGSHYLCALSYKNPEQQQSEEKLRELAGTLKQFELF